MNAWIWMGGFLGYLSILWLAGGMAYRRNRLLPAGDPRKRAVSPFAVLLAPFLLPFALLAMFVVFVVRSLLFGAFLLIFPFLLLLIPDPEREPSWLELRIQRGWEKLGDRLLQLGTFVLDPFGSLAGS